jgi:hypothetical protein
VKFRVKAKKSFVVTLDKPPIVSLWTRRPVGLITAPAGMAGVPAREGASITAAGSLRRSAKTASLPEVHPDR